MYRVDGGSDLAEETLDHFEGWRGSRPVRIGDGAADQLQLDSYGEAADAIFLADSSGIPMAHQGWTALTTIIDWLCEHWDQPEEGIWETRGGRKDYTYGRFQAWVALDRAIRLAQRRLLGFISPRDPMWLSTLQSTGEQLGNFPQEFSHLSLISAAINLDHQLDHGAGSVGSLARPGRRSR